MDFFFFLLPILCYLFSCFFLFFCIFPCIWLLSFFVFHLLFFTFCIFLSFLCIQFSALYVFSPFTFDGNHLGDNVFFYRKTLPKAQRTRGLSSYLKITVLTKPSFRILTKIQLRNLNQTSAAKYWPNFSFKISAALQHQNLDQTLCSKSEQNKSLALWSNISFQTCNQWTQASLTSDACVQTSYFHPLAQMPAG